MKSLQEYAALVEERLPGYILAKCDASSTLARAMLYSLMAGGKRLRPAMLLAAVDMLGGNSGEAMVYACAVEMIHTYSLIHDDLPGMDNDVLRRGIPTNHVKFGEGQAILAGDGLLSLAAELMLEDALTHPGSMDRRVAAAWEIIRGAGAFGMVAGQSLDLACEREHVGGSKELDLIFLGKTCRMFIHPLRAAARLAVAEEWAVDALDRYGLAFGRMFQATDDMLDIEGNASILGKSVGKDEKGGKLTAIGVYGLEGARALVDEEMAKALEALEPFGPEADFFRELVRSMRGRDR